ncbi:MULTISPECIES: LysR family transcriptional regulator [Vibrio]|uniref:LysR family transcriptional regulator n=1 Tax=Vibrio TaxID=662 RepID=UPI0001B93C10|nr:MULTISPECIES: LysR family transcriptional regulator [Vibrio]EEX32395.1 transcriptional regulator LysR family protein [Vibrio coralliilyticus ATCC BAA-450]MCM5508096.1 LysR family transcriptional regulator [Vibrio sp. SCSIO 43169]MDE3897646.1 LysR family transcriptional regulator [Vibrio sp. CC007]QFT39308.1 HTH-type transcriptional regulator CatM [Vibrio sp. THAF64]QGM36154.1 HTH-type transcriptional regulator CatM [Vibrio sp. THAF191d]
MDLEHLKAFCVLAESKNYRLASERLFITQSALTKKIQRLEEKTAARLFERGRHGAVLSAAGQTLLPEAKQLVERFEQFHRLSELVSQGVAGHLNIGFGISTYHQAPHWVAQFKQRYPDVSMTLNDIPSQTQLEKLNSGELDLSFNRIPDEGRYDAVALYSDQLVVAVHESEHLDEGNLWCSLRNMHYLKLASNRGPGLNLQIERYLMSQHQNLAADQEADDILTLLALVSARLGYTIMPKSAQQIHSPSVRYIPLGGEYTSWQVGLVWQRDNSNPLVSRFVDLVKSR